MDTGVARVGSVPLAAVASATVKALKQTLGKGGARHLREGEARRRPRVRAPPVPEGIAEQDRRVPVRPRPGRVRDRVRGDEQELAELRAALRAERAVVPADARAGSLEDRARAGRRSGRATSSRRSRSGTASSASRRSISAARAIRARRCAQAASRCATRVPGSRSPSRTRSSPTRAQAPSRRWRRWRASRRRARASPSCSRSGTVTETYKVSPLTDPKLPAGSVVVKLQITATDGKKKVRPDRRRRLPGAREHAVGCLHVRRQGHDVRRRAADRVPRRRAEHAQPRRRRARRLSSRSYAPTPYSRSASLSDVFRSVDSLR